jgi:peptide-methionine (R)-S-oxide reductase
MEDDQWKKKLSKEQYRILRLRQTETPYSGVLLHNDKTGKYLCGACGQTLFDSSTKFDSRSGWPSFNWPVNKKAIKLSEDRSLGIRRVEVSCARCGSHLGHVFNDAPDQPTGIRFCINSLALDFKEKKIRDNLKKSRG